MKIVKTFKVRVCLGNGKPVETSIKAANGPEAMDKAKVEHPGALQVHVLGYAAPPKVVTPAKPKAKPTPPPPPVIFDDNSNIPLDVRDCLRMHKLGLSLRAIAAQLNIGKTTVSNWLKLYGAETYSLTEDVQDPADFQNWG